MVLHSIILPNWQAESNFQLITWTWSFNRFTLFTYYSKVPSKEEDVLLDNTFGPLSFKEIFIGQTGMSKIEPKALAGSEETLELFMSDGNIKFESFPFSIVSI